MVLSKELTGEDVLYVRKLLDLDQVELAKLCCLSQKSICKYETRCFESQLKGIHTFARHIIVILKYALESKQISYFSGDELLSLLSSLNYPRFLVLLGKKYGVEQVC